ncbi:hypothetical protein [Nocardia sp. NPDC052566]|uniref:hypothetical protein n=1 Tax=Nocardia sp. NPDC052566 TaxID=3364330 RepID=UPI0037C74B71
MGWIYIAVVAASAIIAAVTENRWAGLVFIITGVVVPVIGGAWFLWISRTGSTGRSWTLRFPWPDHSHKPDHTGYGTIGHGHNSGDGGSGTSS